MFCQNKIMMTNNYTRNQTLICIGSYWAYIVLGFKEVGRCWYIYQPKMEVASTNHRSVMNLILWVGYKNNSCIRETQENLIKFLVQSSLPYILLLMVHAHYCASYPKWPCVWYEANMCCLCGMMSLHSRTFYSILLSLVISLVTMPSTCDWCDSMTDKP